MRNPLTRTWRDLFKRPLVRALGHTLERDTKQLIAELRRKAPKETPKRRWSDRFK